ncbi:MAG: carbohydrate-binding family 9-like protein [Verrucomicrobia bacterium]|nr:carbohydrate-binding family 9-like protein [Verrucomicrobiota bacterium]
MDNTTVPRSYFCQRVAAPMEIDGSMRDAGWASLPWSEDFVDITGDESLRPRFRTRVKMGWDDTYFYVGAEMEEPHVWGTLTERNAIMFNDNDFEVFIDPDGDGLNYYEFEINALGTIWELSLPKPYGEGGVPILGCNLPGLKSAVHVRGTLNDPSDCDEGWSVEVAFLWKAMAGYNPERPMPPSIGDVWKVNFSRVQWEHEVVSGEYIRIPPHGTPLAESLNPEEQEHPEDNWVWSPQGAVNMHLPLRWGEVEFR